MELIYLAHASYLFTWPCALCLYAYLFTLLSLPVYLLCSLTVRLQQVGLHVRLNLRCETSAFTSPGLVHGIHLIYRLKPTVVGLKTEHTAEQTFA